MLRNRLKLRGPGYLSLLLLLSLLIGCRDASNDNFDAQQEPQATVAIEATHTPISTEQKILPTATATTAPTATVIAAAVPTELPTMIPTETGETTTLTGSQLEANADVEFVRAVQSADGSWAFQVTVRHPDTGWEDYADGWDVVTTDGMVLKRVETDPFTRLLLHPHESEQPFTRGQSGLRIPDGISQVTVRAHDLVDGFGGRQVIVDLTVSSGPDFEVERQ